MKKLLLSLTAGALSVATMYGQGRVNFNNQSTFLPADTITIGTPNMGAVGGLLGEGIGGDKYSVQLRWAAGTIATQGAFDLAVTAGTTSAAFTGAAFLANTGPLATFSGFFDAGTVAMGAPSGTFTMQTWAWYSVGAANGTYPGTGNYGASQLFTVSVTASPTPVNSTVFPGFTVIAVPEPSTFALAGLGAAALLLFRRRK